jgi:hypothetical protein
MNITEKKQPISQRIFTLIRDVPNLNEEQVHEFMSKEMKYKTGSGKSLLYRMIRCKYIRKDKNGILHAHIDEYKAMPPFVKKKKKVVKVESGLAAAAKAKQDHMNREVQAVHYRQAAMNEVGLAGVLVPRPVAKPAKKDFLRELGRRIGSYFRP